jgi:hypothetical protein
MICPRCRQNIQEIEYGLCKECYTEIIKKENSENQSMIEKLEADNKNALDVLNNYGVPESRANTVSKGIQVLVTRFDKEIEGFKFTISKLEADKAELLEALKEIYEDIDGDYVAIKTLCNNLIQKMGK